MEKGGAEIVFRNTISVLNREEYKNRCINYVVSKKGKSSLNVDLDLATSSGAETVLGNIYSWRNFRKLKKFLFEIQPDIIHLQHYANLSPAILHAIYVYKKKRAVRVIQTLHTFERVCSNFSGYDYHLNKRCIDCAKDKYRYKIFYRHCSRGGILHSLGKGITALIADFFYNRGVIDSIVAPSDFLKNTLSSRINDTSSIQTIRNPISDTFLKQRASVEKKEDLLVSYGRLSEEKNWDLLITALSEYKMLYFNELPIRVKLIGDGKEREYLISLAREKGVDFIEFIPFLKQAALISEINSAKVAVLPSKCYESFSLFVIETIALNILPLVAGHGGMLEAVERFKCGVTFASDNMQSLAEQIYYCMKSYSKLDKNFVEAKKEVEAELNEREYARKLWEVYDCKME
ncbi:glycosyltransferase family 4 protein [Chitinophaga defluvii]|uniref:Glycosyltransferase family 4 protein n=1 Tax=Chitinophaga defluvii TaxID=3163343 RepID=A0ABV2T6X0_9BACT